MAFKKTVKYNLFLKNSSFITKYLLYYVYI
jgi:hypothetical protein